MPIYRNKAEMWREKREDKKARKKAMRCLECDFMEKGWCKKHKSWCDQALSCSKRFPQ